MGNNTSCCKDNSSKQFQISQLTAKPSILNTYQNFMSMHPTINQIVNNRMKSFYQLNINSNISQSNSKSKNENGSNVNININTNTNTNNTKINKNISKNQYKKSILIKSKQYKEQDGIFIGEKLGQQNNNNIKNGYGIMLYNDNNYYQGQWQQNKKNGYGLYVSQNGTYYYGQWKNNLAQGSGIYQSIYPKLYYNGQWKQGFKCGKGVEEYEDGSIYTGDFLKGMKNGQGKLIYANGTSYQGEFKDNSIQGIGIYKGKNHVYEGSWKSGKMHGTGRSQWMNQKGAIIAKYVGEYRQGIKEGFGEYTDSRGVIYKATWLKGEINQRGPIITQKNNF